MAGYPVVAGVVEVAAELGVAMETVRGWKRKGYLKPFELPGSVGRSSAFDLERVRVWFATSPPRPGPRGPRKAKLER
jgi:hypothetical protein